MSPSDDGMQVSVCFNSSLGGYKSELGSGNPLCHRVAYSFGDDLGSYLIEYLQEADGLVAVHYVPGFPALGDEDYFSFLDPTKCRVPCVI